ncbi:MAG: glycosyltransferase, partial [Marinifilaceae bacterium]
NVEKYIRKCIESCLNQQNHTIEYEVIVIIDGSQDRSYDFAQEYLEKFPNYKILTQENKGLSATRNRGLSEAKGNYVWFVDSDDYITSDAINLLSLYLTYDLIHINHYKFYENGTQLKYKDHCLISGTGKQITYSGGIGAPAQFTIYRRDFLLKNNLRFVEGIYHEDSEFTPRALFYAEKCIVINEYLYYYLQRESGSIMSSFSIKRAIDMIFVNNNLYLFAQKEIQDTKLRRIFYNKIALNINSLLDGLIKLTKEERYKVYEILKKNKHLFKAMYLSTNHKYRIEGLCLLFNLHLSLKLYKLTK